MPVFGQAIFDRGGRISERAADWPPSPKPFHLLWCATVFFRKIAALCLIATFAIATSGPTMAQQNHGNTRGVSRSVGVPASHTVADRNAVKRTTWQPVRPVQATDELPIPKSEPVPIPIPMPMSRGESVTVPGQGGQSILRNPGSTLYHGPMDGEVIYEGGFVGDEQISGGYGCDAIGGCDGGCDGGCGFHGSCGQGCCDPGAPHAWRPCLTLCLPQNGWVSFEYLGWWQRGMALPPLVTTSGTGTAAANAGVIGQNNPTRVLFGGEDVFEDGFSGGRLQFGIWLDRCHTWSAAAEYFELGSRTESFSATSNGANPILARPFVNVLNGLNDSQIVAYPGIANGGLTASATSSLAGGGFHFRRQTNCNSGCGHGILCDGCSTFHSRTDALFGYRYLQLDESISVHENFTGINPAGSFQINDQFRTMNQFNGFDMGILYERCRGPWSIDLLAKLALGNTRQRVDISGSTVINAVRQDGGGLLAQQGTNIGSHSRDQFTILPELGGRLGYQLTHNLKLKLGYTLIFWSNVVRPGDQIDLGVNPNLFPPAVGNGLPARPEFVFRDTDYWVQGITFGGEFQW
ncbi:MAG TPA: hypothetical protein DDZ51_04215 [Planctomycetaceae bacterium]|nr:hypothetical protein [Planctomycetaceae bacterium]